MRAGGSGEGDGARVFHKGGVSVLEGTNGRGGASELGRTHRVRDLGGTSRDRELGWTCGGGRDRNSGGIV